MPTYEYACKKCGEHLEVVQSFRDDPLTTCSSCGGELRKVFGAIGIAFKGSGFYRTDSRGASGKAGNKSRPEPSGGDSGKTDAKTDSGRAEAKTSGSSDDKAASGS